MHQLLEKFMDENVYKTTEIVGSSTESIEDAVRRAVDRAGQTLRHMRWLEVGEIRGHIADGAVAHWQVTVKIGFTME
jgi:dodecin